ncbi:MAG: V-type ATP synthase subunit E [Desulfurococcaceae archaeon]
MFHLSNRLPPCTGVTRVQGAYTMSSELRRAILGKAEEEARKIIHSAEEEARRIVDEAYRLKQQEIVKEKEKVVKEVNYEARIAEARLKARMLIAEAKSNMLKMLESSVREYLDRLSPQQRERSLSSLMKEAVRALLEDLGAGSEIVVYVSGADLETARKVAGVISTELGIRIDIRELNISGGVIASSLDGSVIVDNSYEARLKKIIKASLSEISREVFGL